MKQFRHEPQGYVPFRPAESLKNRPFWVKSDELIRFDLEVKSIFDKIVKIETLTKEEFLFFQKNKAIPESYKVDDWITE